MFKNEKNEIAIRIMFIPTGNDPARAGWRIPPINRGRLCDKLKIKINNT